jgi:hypothetical protein
VTELQRASPLDPTVNAIAPEKLFIAREDRLDGGVPRTEGVSY